MAVRLLSTFRSQFFDRRTGRDLQLSRTYLAECSDLRTSLFQYPTDAGRTLFSLVGAGVWFNRTGWCGGPSSRGFRRDLVCGILVEC